MKKLFLIIFLIPSMCFPSTWECINRSISMCNTWRMYIPSGWIVASDNSATGGKDGYAMVFVPDQKHIWKD